MSSVFLPSKDKYMATIDAFGSVRKTLLPDLAPSKNLTPSKDHFNSKVENETTSELNKFSTEFQRRKFSKYTLRSRSKKMSSEHPYPYAKTDESRNPY
jgi:hypothetical protein